MNTDQLIEDLSRGLAPVRPHALAMRIALGLAAGAAVTLTIVLLGLGLRPDFEAAVRGFAFWMKWGYTISLALVAAVLLSRLARPVPSSMRTVWLLPLPVLALAALALRELAAAAPGERVAIWLGSSWWMCPWLMLALAAPIFGGLIWSFRALAPTRLLAAGANAGFVAGACAATLYALQCPETAASFVLTWYSLGMLLATGLGALLGPRLLRW